MFHFLFYLPHADQYAVLRLFKYLTFRSGGAVLTALFIAFWIGPALIRWLKLKQGKGQPIRSDGPQRHIVEKQGTPTMGGLLILIPVVVTTLLWADLSNAYVWIVLLVTVSYGALGFADDYLKVMRRSSDGVSGRVRLLVEFGVAFVATWLIMQVEDGSQSGILAVPFFKTVMLPLGLFFIVVGGFVIAGRCQCGEFHRWARRPRHHAGDDCGGRIRADRLSRRQREDSPTTSSSTISAIPASLLCSWPR